MTSKLIKNRINKRASEMRIAPCGCSRDKSKAWSPECTFTNLKLTPLALATMLSSLSSNLSHAARAPDNAQREGL